MKLSSLSDLAAMAPILYGRALPLTPERLPSTRDDDPYVRAETMHEAISALRVLCALYEDPKTRTLALVLYYVFVRHGAAARADSQFLARLAVDLTVLAKPVTFPLSTSKLLKWQTKGFLLFQSATRLWARTQPKQTTKGRTDMVNHA